MYKYLNIVGFLIVIIINTLANTLPINGQTTGSVSLQYDNYFTPAGFTFGIWSLIYFSLLVFVIFQAISKENTGSRIAIHKRLTYVFILNCLANVAWILAWHYLQFGTTLILMLILLTTLVDINLRVKEYSWIIRFPFRIYLGWICVATVANFAVYFKFIEWSAWGLLEVYWGITMVLIAGLLGIWLVVKNSYVVVALTIAWGIFGILMKQSTEDMGYRVVCLVVIALIGIVSGWKIVSIRIAR